MHTMDTLVPLPSLLIAAYNTFVEPGYNGYLFPSIFQLKGYFYAQ